MKNSFLLLAVILFWGPLTAEAGNGTPLPEEIQTRFEQAVTTLAGVPGMTNFAVSELRGPQITDPSIKTPEAAKQAVLQGIEDLKWVQNQGYVPQGLYYLLGAAHASLLDWDQTVSYFKLSLEKDPQVESAYTNLLAIFWDQKRFDETPAIFERYRQVFPDKEGPYYFLKGVEQDRLENEAEATEAFERAVQADPQLVEARLALGAAYLERGETEAADEQFQQVVQMVPQLEGLVKHIRTQVLQGAEE